MLLHHTWISHSLSPILPNWVLRYHLFRTITPPPSSQCSPSLSLSVFGGARVLFSQFCNCEKLMRATAAIPNGVLLQPSLAAWSCSSILPALHVRLVTSITLSLYHRWQLPTALYLLVCPSFPFDSAARPRNFKSPGRGEKGRGRPCTAGPGAMGCRRPRFPCLEN